MLVIFDLDDTLVETTKCLSDHYLRLAFETMVERGLKDQDFESLRVLNEKSLSAKEALRIYCEERSVAKEIFEAGIQSGATPLSKNLSLDPVPDAIQVLDELKKNATLALVSIGDENLQREKLKKAGIQPSYFSKLVICAKPSKKLAYKQLVVELAFAPEKVIVVGDRVPLDLTPAKELGFFTVHFRNGRGKVYCHPRKSVDVTIERMKQLQEVLQKHEV